MILLVWEKKFIKNTNYQFWKYSIIAKFFITILFLTPILDALIGSSQKESKNTSNIIKFIVGLLLTLYSPFLRFYREYYLKSEPENYDR